MNLASVESGYVGFVSGDVFCRFRQSHFIVLVICTEWNEFRRPTLDRFNDHMKKTVTCARRDLFDLGRARKASVNLYYYR